MLPAYGQQQQPQVADSRKPKTYTEPLSSFLPQGQQQQQVEKSGSPGMYTSQYTQAPTRQNYTSASPQPPEPPNPLLTLLDTGVQAGTQAGMQSLLNPAEAGISSAMATAGEVAPYGLMTDSAGAAIGTMAPPLAPVGGFGMGATLPMMGGAIAAPLVAQGTLSGVQNIFNGEDLNFQQEAALALPTFGASFLYDPIKDFFGSGKDAAQQQRDQIKEGLRERGFVTDNWGLRLADGSEYELRDDPQYMTPDFAKQQEADLVALANPFAYSMANGNKDLAAAYAGWMTRAAYSNADNFEGARNNLLQIVNDFGRTHNVDPMAMMEQIKGMQTLNDQEKQVMLNSVMNLSVKK